MVFRNMLLLNQLSETEWPKSARKRMDKHNWRQLCARFFTRTYAILILKSASLDTDCEFAEV